LAQAYKIAFAKYEFSDQLIKYLANQGKRVEELQKAIDNPAKNYEL